MERDFSLGGKDFRLSKLDAFKQFHVVRRIAPILSDVFPVIVNSLKKSKVGAVKDIDKLSEESKLQLVSEFIGPVMAGMSKLNDADAEFTLLTLLSAVEMKQPTGWARVSTGTLMMINDFEFPSMVHLAVRSFMFNLSGFFAGLPQK